MNTFLPDESAPLPSGMSDSERELRVELAACYHLVDHLGWSESIFNHISVRVPGPDRHFLINPFGLNYDEVTASSLVKIDVDGRPVGPHRHEVNYAGFIIHSAIHVAREDAHCIMHTHTTAGSAVASKTHGLRRDNFYSALLSSAVAYHDFEGITMRADERPRLIASLGSKPVLILRNHGLLVAGRSIPHAFSLMWELQRACEIQCASDSMQGTSISVSEGACIESARIHDASDSDVVIRKVFDAAIRKMEMARRREFVNFRS